MIGPVTGLGEGQVQFGQVSPEMGRTENPKMPDFGNQPPRGLSGGLIQSSLTWIEEKLNRITAYPL